MNLVKNGAVLLAALGMFTATSCGGNKETKKEITREAALEWVTANYKATTKIGLTEGNQKWDYTKNVTKEKLPDDFPLEDFRGKNGDDLTQYALVEAYSITDPSKKTGNENTKDIDNWGGDKYFFTEPLNKDNFEDLYPAEEKDHEYKFYLLNNKVLVTSETWERGFAQDAVKYTYTDERTFNKEGYGEKQLHTIHNDKVEIKNPVDKKVYDLGKLHLLVTITKVS